MMYFHGIPVSEGIALAKVLRYWKIEFNIPLNTLNSPEKELSLFNQALTVSKKEIENIKKDVAQSLDQVHAQVFDAHIQILTDPAILEEAQKKIERGSSAPQAYREVADKYIQMFSKIDDAYLRERALDLKDVAERVLSKLLGVKQPELSHLYEDVIVLAHDLTPSDTAKLDRKHVKGIVSEVGGGTSHAAIMIKALGIPAVLGLKKVLNTEGDFAIIDGGEGVVILSPTEKEIEYYRKLLVKKTRYYKKMRSLIPIKGKTQDGKKIELTANINSPGDVYSVLKAGAEGIGLMRTEFLFMHTSSFPSEDKQYHIYRQVLNSMKDKKVIIRTLDIGGDKKLAYFKTPYEKNPFLGNRGIRFCFNQLDIFKIQLRALLRANIYGNLHLMLPMITTVEEVKEAKKLLKEVEEEIKKELGEIAAYQLGIMVEVPSVALASEMIAREVDFFSIGSNDLIQYTLAADRMNELVSSLYQPLHPAVLRLIQMTVEAAHKEGKWVGVCGEMASDMDAIPLLIGLGVDELSMNVPAILPTKDRILHLNYQKAKIFAEEALGYENEQAVIDAVRSRLPVHNTY